MGMEARNRRLPDWLGRMRTGQLVLPRFQRFERWGNQEIVTLLDSVLRGRPVGATLVLAIGDKEPFISRPMAGVPEATARINEHLLDGQQRLTALWRALNDGYAERTYFAVLNPAPGSLTVRGESRWISNRRHYPLWADQPIEQFNRGLVPMRLLNPAVKPGEIGNWCDLATSSAEESRILERQVAALQTAVREANLPYLELPVETPSDVAIDVFILMNTTLVQLSAFDIAVAQLEAATGQSLHQLEASLRSAVPAVDRYVKVPRLVLQIAALRQNLPGTESSFKRLNMQKLSSEWKAIEKGTSGAIKFLEQEHIFDQDRLPTVAVVPVLASIWSQMPQSLDAHGGARTLLRQYLWRSFFTERYDRGAATAALQDYRGLKARVVDGDITRPIRILDESEFPIVRIEQLEQAPWPRLRNTLARAILAVSLRSGGRDFADDTPVSYDSLTRREYHHLFPEALLKNEASMDEAYVNLALNCALLTWNTNRNISAKEPVTYLRERAERAPLGEEQIRNRLNSHIIPFDQLNVGGYSSIADVEEKSAKIKSDYAAFIKARARAMHQVIQKLCNGEDWNG